jgi:hypothetical protein
MPRSFGSVSSITVCRRWDNVAMMCILRQRPAGLLFLSSLLITAAFGGIRGPGKYNGVVVFDRWDGCHLYSGVYVMEISEQVKESLRPYQDQTVLIDALKVEQPMNPGDGLITKLNVLGPAEEEPRTALGPDLEGLTLSVAPDFSATGTNELIIDVRNTSNQRREIQIDALAPTLFAKKEGAFCLVPADGPSYAAVTRSNLRTMQDQAVGSTCLLGRTARTARLFMAPGISYASRLELDPGQSIEIPLRFQLSSGEYEFLAGYGGGVHAGRALASNRIGFDVDETGHAHLLKGAAAPAPRTPRRVGRVCGTVSLEDGSPAANARVFLWPFPMAQHEPRAANSELTDSTGRFRTESVLEGLYVLSALFSDAGAIMAGAFGGTRPSDGAPLAVPDSADGCTLSVTLHRQPGYTVAGRILGAGAAGRKVRMTMTGGDAVSYQSTAEIQPDGRYEFHNVPAGPCDFSAGSTGWGHEVTEDVEDDLEREWTETAEETAEPSTESDETMTIFTLEEFHRALSAYTDTYPRGFAPSLKALGPPPKWYRTAADHAGLIDEWKARKFSPDGMHFSDYGYSVTYRPGAADDQGKITTYTLSARPLGLGKAGARSFVHGRERNRPRDHCGQTSDTIRPHAEELSRISLMEFDCQRIGLIPSCWQILRARRLSISPCRGTGAFLPFTGFV